ncbi:MAG: hypothetical protein ACJ748_02665 [Flavisolibacter sp.]
MLWKNGFLYALLLISLKGISQSDTSEIKVIIPPDSTAIGKPEGIKNSKLIGQEGGTISSSDNRVQLIFPAGALSSSTSISIQASTNTAPNGSGKSYQFEPSGIHFQKPVQIIFHYSDEEAKECPADLMGLALQNEKGKWSFIDYEAMDSNNRILKGFIRHFTTYSNVKKIALVNLKEELKVEESSGLEFYDITTKFGENQIGANPDGPGWAKFSKKEKINWYVNAIENGNIKEGQIKSVRFLEYSAADYYSPRIMTVQNPVVITANIYILKGKSRKVLRTLQCKILIYDEYHIQIIHEFTGRTAMGSQLIDSGSFDVRISPVEIKIDNIKNYEPIVVKEGKNGPFREKIYVKDELGTVHITPAINKTNLSKEYPPEVYIDFARFKIPLYKYEYSARGIKGGIQSLSFLSIPSEITFVANGENQKVKIQEVKAYIDSDVKVEDADDEPSVQEFETNYHLIITPIRGKRDK